MLNEKAKNTAFKLLDKFGKVGTYKRKGGQIYDPETGGMTEQTSEYKVKAYIDSAKSYPNLIEKSLLNEGDNVIHLRTLRRVNGIALCQIDHYFSDLTLWPLLQGFNSGSLHDYLREQSGLTLLRTQTRISARRAQAKESKVLEIPNMAPLLCVRTLNHREGEEHAAEYSVSLTRADMIEFTMEH